MLAWTHRRKVQDEQKDWGRLLLLTHAYLRTPAPPLSPPTPTLPPFQPFQVLPGPSPLPVITDWSVVNRGREGEPWGSWREMVLAPQWPHLGLHAR